MSDQAKINAAQKERRKRTSDSDRKKYEKTPSGFLMRLYRNMKSRVSGVQKLKHHLYAGKELLSKEDFYAWANDHIDFHRLFAIWAKSGHDRRLTPSVDRIDSSKGYTLDNMRWLTHSQNSAITSRTKTATRAAIYAAIGVQL